MLTPYRADVNAAVRRYIEARGCEVPVFGSFDEEDDHRAARIDVASIRDAAIELGRDPRVDAVFVACTSLRVAEVAAEIEEVDRQAGHVEQPCDGLARAAAGRDCRSAAAMG